MIYDIWWYMMIIWAWLTDGHQGVPGHQISSIVLFLIQILGHHPKWLGPIEMGPKNFSRSRFTTNHVDIGRESQPGSSIFYIVYIVYISLIDIIDGVIHKSCYPTDGDLKRQHVSGFFQKMAGGHAGQWVPRSRLSSFSIALDVSCVQKWWREGNQPPEMSTLDRGWNMSYLNMTQLWGSDRVWYNHV